MAAAFLTVFYVLLGNFAFSGFAICREYRWVRRLEYEWRLDHRVWDAYWPIVVPSTLVDERF